MGTLFCDLSNNQNISGTKNFSTTPKINNESLSDIYAQKSNIVNFKSFFWSGVHLNDTKRINFNNMSGNIFILNMYEYFVDNEEKNNNWTQIVYKFDKYNRSYEKIQAHHYNGPAFPTFTYDSNENNYYDVIITSLASANVIMTGMWYGITELV